MYKKKLFNLLTFVSLFFGIIILGVSTSLGCTCGVVGNGGTADGSILFYHNEELSKNTAMRLDISPRANHEPGEMIDTGNYMLPQFPVTYKTVVMKYCPGGYGLGGDWAAGTNEYGVCLAGDRAPSKETSLPEGEGIGYGYLTQITLERSRTAREAVKTVGWLIDGYGRDGGESAWIFADPHEVWILEQSYTHWVAYKLGYNEFWPMSNRYKIGTNFELSSPDVVEYAIDRGWHDPSNRPFSWKDVYGTEDSLNNEALIIRENRQKELLEEKWGSITLVDMSAFRRDHFEGTDKEIGSPHEYEDPNRPLCIDRSVFGFVYHIRDWLPPEIGATAWYSMNTVCSSVHVPIYAGITMVPEVYSMLLGGEPDQFSAWWRFRTLVDNVDTDYEVLNPHVRGVWTQFEAQELNETKELEEKAFLLHERGDVEGAAEMLTEYTDLKPIAAYDEAKVLNNWILDQKKAKK